MGKRATNSGKKGKRSVRWLKLFCICLACFALAKIGQQYLRYRDILAEVAYYEGLLQEAEQRYDEVQDQLELLYNDSYLEQLARSNLGMVMYGEVVVTPAEISDIVPALDTTLRDQDVNH